MLLAGASALAISMGLAAPAPKAQTTNFTLDTDLSTSSGSLGSTPTTWSGVGGSLNDLASQINAGSTITANAFTAGPGSTFERETRSINVDTVDGDFIAVIDSTTSDGVLSSGNGLFRIFAGDADRSVVAIEANDVLAQAVGSSASRTLDLDQVLGSAPTALLGVVQSNNLVRATAQVGSNASGSATTTEYGVTINPESETPTVVTGLTEAQVDLLLSITSGSFDLTNEQFAALIAELRSIPALATLLNPSGPLPGDLNLFIAVTATQVTPNEQPAGVRFLVEAGYTTDEPSSVNDVTASLSANSVQALVQFNVGSQIATGSAQSPDLSGEPASVVTTLAGLGGTDVSSPISVVSVQSNSAVNLDLDGAPTASVYNTAFDVLFRYSNSDDDESTPPTHTVSQIANNTVASGLAGNTASNSLLLSGASSAALGNGLAVVSTQANSLGNVDLGFFDVFDGETPNRLSALTTNTTMTISSTFVDFDGDDTSTGLMRNSTATITGNLVTSSATGNVGSNTLANTMMTSLHGVFTRDGESANVIGDLSDAFGSIDGDFPTVSVNADVLVMSAQINSFGIAIGAITLGTTALISAQMESGVAAIEGNTVSAVSTLNSQANSLTALRGETLTVAAVNLQTNLFTDARSTVANTSLTVDQVPANASSTVSLSDNTIGSVVDLNTAAQNVTASLISPGLGTSEYATVSFGLSDLPSVSVGAQVSSTSMQLNVVPQIADFDGDTATPTALTTNTVIQALLSNERDTDDGFTPNAVTIAGNTVSASFTGNRVTNSVNLTGTATNSVHGAAVVSTQGNFSFGLDGPAILARTIDTTLLISTDDDLNGTATILNNSIASTARGNDSANALGNTVLSSLVGHYGGTIADFDGDTPRTFMPGSVLGDYVVANAQLNSGLVLAAETTNTSLRIYSDDDLLNSTVAAIEGNAVTATSTLNRTANTLTLVRGDGIVGTLSSGQFNEPFDEFAGAPSGAFAQVSNTSVHIDIDDNSFSSAQLIAGNNVRASAAGNRATNTVSNGGLSYGSVYQSGGSFVASGNVQGYGDYQLVNQQGNFGTSGTPMPIQAAVENASFRVLNLESSGDQRNSMAQIGGNIVLASAMGNEATNRVAVTGMVSASQAAASLQTNEFVSINANVQNVTMTIASGSRDNFRNSTGSIVGNTVGATATGNSLVSFIGR